MTRIQNRNSKGRIEDAYKIGDKFKTKQGYEVTLKEKISNQYWVVEFHCGFTKKISQSSVTNGTIRYPFHPTVFGVGYLGCGPYSSGTSKKKTRAYETWQHMIRRCYDERCRSYARYGGRGVTVCDEWLNFQNFAEWFYRNYVEGFKLDKDLTIIGSKQYNPDSCSFVPVSVNNLLISSNACRGSYPVGVSYSRHNKSYLAECWNGDGSKVYLGHHKSPESAFQTYKKFKENVIKQVAEKHYINGSISETIYKNLINWEVVEYPE